MNREDLIVILGILFISGLIFSLILVLIDEGTLTALLNQMRCKLGRHKNEIKVGKIKINKYRCEHCKEPRKYLKAVDNDK